MILLKLMDPILQIPINASVQLDVENRIENTRYICGQLHLEIRNAQHTLEKVEEYLINEFGFSISNRRIEDKAYHIFTAAIPDLFDVPTLKTVVITLGYLPLTEPLTLLCCIKSILKGSITVVPIAVLQRIYASKCFKNATSLTIERVILCYLKSGKKKLNKRIINK